MGEAAAGQKRKPLSQLTLVNGSIKIRRKENNNEEDSQRRAGNITKMVLKNFMCHSLLEVDFSSNVSIIIGRNGSGKSAILTALVVGLGGKASLTNRGNSIKGFIKAGKPSGSVEIELCNSGPMAYKSQVYGNRITIIRHISASGCSTYRVKAETGETVANTAKEIQNITTSLNIQVDNPICILNQDTSRNFLSSNDPRHKFTLFMKATKLETLAEEYSKVVANKNIAIRTFEDKEKNLNALKTELKELKKKIEHHRSIVGIRDKIKQTQLEMLWAQVRDIEDELSKEEALVADLTQQEGKITERCTNKADRIKTIKENISSLERQMGELKDTIQVQSRPQADVKRIIDELKNNANEKRRQKHSLHSTVETKTKDAAALEHEIASANENMTKVEQEKMQRLRNLSNMEEKLRGMEDHLQTTRNDLYQIRSDVSRKEGEQQGIQEEISQVERKISNERSSLNALKSEQGNSLLLYGPDMPRLKHTIEQNKHRFSHMPRGPLGSYVTLKDKKWAVAVEGFLGPGMLSAFTVNNGQDNAVLREIFDKCLSGRKPMIITSKFLFKKHNVSQNLVHAPPDCVSLYEALEIQDPVVSNCIVDQSQIEGILLIPTTDRAIQLLSNRANVPPNCRQGVTAAGDKFYPDPKYRSYGSRYHRARFLQVDTKEHMMQLEASIKSLQQKKEQLMVQLNGSRTEMRAHDARKNELEEKIRKLAAARVALRNKLEELRATAEPEVANVQMLETELVEIRNLIREKQALLSRLDEEIAEIKSAIAENEEKLAQLKNSNKGLEERMIQLEAQMQEDSIRLKEISSSDEFDKRRIKELNKKLSQAKESRDQKQSKLDEYVANASSIGERVQTRRKVPDLVAELSQMERSVRRIETQAENIEQIGEKYRQMHEKHEKAAEIMSCLNDDIRELGVAVEERKRHYKLTENYFVTYIQHSFKKIMEVRQFQGSININMTDKKLEMVVMPRQGSQQMTTTNLSGGERSFSTVAFLYSLWQCMEFPFYFLDEFDVYMDKLNRTKVLDILIHHAKSHPQAQFVFLTPQDVSFVDKSVSILRLADPERRREV